MLHTKTYCGNEGEIMFEEVLKHGYITASELIIKSYKRIEESPCKSHPSIAISKHMFQIFCSNILFKYFYFLFSDNKQPLYVT